MPDASVVAALHGAPFAWMASGCGEFRHRTTTGGRCGKDQRFADCGARPAFPSLSIAVEFCIYRTNVRVGCGEGTAESGETQCVL